MRLGIERLLDVGVALASVEAIGHVVEREQVTVGERERLVLAVVAALDPAGDPEARLALIVAVVPHCIPEGDGLGGSEEIAIAAALILFFLLLFFLLAAAVLVLFLFLRLFGAFVAIAIATAVLLGTAVLFLTVLLFLLAAAVAVRLLAAAVRLAATVDRLLGAGLGRGQLFGDDLLFRILLSEGVIRTQVGRVGPGGHLPPGRAAQQQSGRDRAQPVTCDLHRSSLQ